MKIRTGFVSNSSSSSFVYLLKKEDYELITAMGQTILYLSQVLQEKQDSIVRLLRLLFGAPTEKTKKDTYKKPTAKKSKKRDTVKTGRITIAEQRKSRWSMPFLNPEIPVRSA